MSPTVSDAAPPGIRAAAATTIYAFLGIVGLVIARFAFGDPQDRPVRTGVMILFEALMAAWAIWFVRRHASWVDVGFGRLRPVALLWVIPIAVPILYALGSYLVAIAGAASGAERAHGTMLPLEALWAALSGFSEELVFRGILLHGLWRGRGLFRAMVASAASFALFHGASVIGGAAPGDAAREMLLSALVGLTFSGIAVKLGSLWPLVALHALWSFLAAGAGAAPFAVRSAAALSIPVAIVLFPVVAVSLRAPGRLNWHEWTGTMGAPERSPGGGTQ